MAIQLRRGSYDQFDPTKLVSGEGAVVLEGDPNVEDGKALYICFSTGSAKRMATFEDMDDIAQALEDEFTDQVGGAVSKAEQFIVTATTQETSRVQAEGDRDAAETDRDEAEQIREFNEQQRQAHELVREGNEENREEAEAQRAAAERARVAAESGRDTAETNRELEEARRTARFAQMELLSKGWLRHYCLEGEYDPNTLVPTIENSNTATIYFVPSDDPSDDNMWVEWIVGEDDDGWERLGTTESKIAPVTTSQIDGIANGETPTGSEVVTLTGLAYFWSVLWSKLTAAFAPLVHVHAPVSATANGFMTSDDKQKLDRIHNTVTWGDLNGTTTWGELKG